MSDNDQYARVRRPRRDALATIAVGAAYGLAFSVVTTFTVFTMTERLGHHHGTALERVGCVAVTILVAVAGVAAGRRHRLPRKRD